MNAVEVASDRRDSVIALRDGYGPGAQRYRNLRGSVSAVVVREGAGSGNSNGERNSGRVDEIELQARWFTGEFGRRFSTPSGEQVEIVQFGHWNRAAGPDFTECVVRIGDRQLSGPIEIDLDARDWEHHGHGSNPAFDDVVLHLFLCQPQGITFFTRNSQHREVAQAELDLGRFDSTRSVAGFVPEAKLGRCAAPLESMEPERIADLLTAAAQFRMQKKARRFEAIAAVQGFLKSTCPVPRMGTCRDVADAVLFLSSDAASYINGTRLVVDGGLTRVHAASALG